MCEITSRLSSFRSTLRLGSIAARHGRDRIGPGTDHVHLEILPNGLLRVRSQRGREHSVSYGPITNPPTSAAPRVTLTPRGAAVLLEAMDADTRSPSQTLTLTFTTTTVRLNTATPARAVNIAKHHPVPDSTFPSLPLGRGITPCLPHLRSDVLRDIADGAFPDALIQFHEDRDAPGLIGWANGIWAYGRTLPVQSPSPARRRSSAAILHERLAALEPLPST